MGLNQTQIADEVGVDKPTVSRESGRNNGRRGWHPKQAQELRDERRKKCVNAQRFSLPEWAEIKRLIRLDHESRTRILPACAGMRVENQPRDGLRLHL